MTVTRHYSDNVTIEFSPRPKVPEVSAKTWAALLWRIGKAVEESVVPDGKGEEWKPIKERVCSYINGKVEEAKKGSEPPNSGKVEEVRKHLLTQANEQWSKDVLLPVTEKLDPIVKDIATVEGLTEAKKWVLKKIPYFLYFGDYEILDSAIYLPEFLQRVSQSSPTPKTRVQHAMFKHVGVNIAELARLGQHCA